MQPRLIRRISFAITLFVCCVATVHADDAVVGTGVSTCNEAALDVALSQLYPGANFPGGTLRFNCGPNQVTIPISNRKTLTGATIVDGGAMITLDGQNSTAHFAIAGAQSRVEVRAITLSRGRANNSSGGAINVGPDTSLLLTDSVIRDSSATFSGGGVHVEAGAGLRIERSSVSNNMAANGGAIASNSELTVIDSTMSDNTASGGEGGAIQQWFAAIDLQHVDFNNNSARRGGALLIRGNGGLASDVLFSANTASEFGGGVALYDGATLQGDDVRFIGNHAAQGGGLHLLAAASGNGQPVSMGSAAVLHDSLFEDNEATGAGGAAFVFGIQPPMGGQYSLLHLYGTRMAGNVANEGGAVWSKGQMRVVDCVFDGNSAARGGAMDLAATFLSSEPELFGYTEITRTDFIGNSASQFGGAMFTVDALPLFNQVNFLRNVAGSVGGAIAASRFIAPITNASFVDNLATSGGGAVYLANNGSIQMINLSFSGNSVSEVGGYGADVAAESTGTGGALPTQLLIWHSTLLDGHADTGSSLFAGGLNTSITLRNSVVLGANEPSCINNAPILTVGGNFMPGSCQPALANDVTVTTRAQLGLSNLSNAISHVQVLVPQTASPLIDHVDCPVGRDTDARGYHAPIDGDGDSVARCDSGAVERQLGEPVAIFILFRNGFESSE